MCCTYFKKSVSGLKIFDCTYNLTAKPNHQEFKDNYYGKFAEKLIPMASK